MKKEYTLSYKIRVDYNLQFFAKDGPGGEKTEPATAKKLTDARKEGQVAKSREISNALGLMTLFLVLKYWVGNLGETLFAMFAVTYSKIPELVKLPGGDISVKDMSNLIQEVMGKFLTTLLPLLLIGSLVAFLGDYVQVKWRPTSKPLKPKFSKLNPIKGFKKIFSPQSIAELIKSIFKVLFITWVVYGTLKKEYNDIFLLYDMPLWSAVLWAGEVAINLGLKIAAVYFIIAFGDLAYQKWKFKEDMKMTKQEVKDEMKNAEGDPQIKSKQRSRMREASMRRMMQSLPQADVVITNPTHYAVAIKYNPELYAAPYVVAKGEDYLAQKIKETAREHNIEIVENKPLARMLYNTVEIGEVIPPELYQAVADVLAMVYQLQGKV